MSILIRGGRIVTAADDVVADLLVEGERIALIGTDLDITADRTIEASGKLGGKIATLICVRQKHLLRCEFRDRLLPCRR